MDSDEVLRRLKAAGGYGVRQKGAHKRFHHAERTGTVTVKRPDRDMAPGTIRSIERQSGVKLR